MYADVRNQGSKEGLVSSSIGVSWKITLREVCIGQSQERNEVRSKEELAHDNGYRT